jgi:hypothetical protein
VHNQAFLTTLNRFKGDAALNPCAAPRSLDQPTTTGDHQPDIPTARLYDVLYGA